MPSRSANSRSDRARPAASSSNPARPRAIALISAGSHLERSFRTATPGSTSLISTPWRLKATGAVSSIGLSLGFSDEDDETGRPKNGPRRTLIVIAFSSNTTLSMRSRTTLSRSTGERLKSTGVGVGSAHGDTHPAGAGCTGATVKGAHGDTHPADEDHSGAAVEGAHGDTHPVVANCAGAKVDDGARGDTNPAVADARETGSSLRGTERWYGALSPRLPHPISRSLSRRRRLILGEEKEPEVNQRGLGRRRPFPQGDQRFESVSLQRGVLYEPPGSGNPGFGL